MLGKREAGQIGARRRRKHAMAPQQAGDADSQGRGMSPIDQGHLAGWGLWGPHAEAGRGISEQTPRVSPLTWLPSLNLSFYARDSDPCQTVSAYQSWPTACKAWMECAGRATEDRGVKGAGLGHLQSTCIKSVHTRTRARPLQPQSTVTGGRGKRS